MLAEISVKNLAVVEDVTVRFEMGFNALTGETGAGKSIIVDAIGLATGRRANSEMIRTGCDSAQVQALFDLSEKPAVAQHLRSQDIETENELIVRRVISKSGGNRVYLNGVLTPLATLRDTGALLANIYGQHESQGLLREELHLELLDDFGGLSELRSTVSEKLTRCKKLSARFEDLTRRESDRTAREDFLKFQIDEIEKADIRDGELRELEARRLRLSGANQLSEAAHAIRTECYEAEGSIAERAENLKRAIGKVERFDPEFARVVESLEQIAIGATEAGNFARDYLGGLDHDPNALETIEDRLHVIRSLAKKYGGDERAVLSACEKARAELDELESLSELLKNADREYAEAGRDLLKTAKKLEKARVVAGEKMSKNIQRQLADLDMKGAHFVPAIQPLDGAGIRVDEVSIDSTGCNRVTFLLSANPGEEPRPLSRIASGGELSRILLAIKNALTTQTFVPTLIFDEVDAGIGGRQAETVGEKLSSVAKAHQVLCITHLPQIAAKADHHLVVTKSIRKGRTRADVARLGKSERVEETARMLSGKSITEEARAAARKILGDHA
jgi:DNA repair protein RecN (Recombination protein N)